MLLLVSRKRSVAFVQPLQVGLIVGVGLVEWDEGVALNTKDNGFPIIVWAFNFFIVHNSEENIAVNATAGLPAAQFAAELYIPAAS
ncbi:MAG: hypothetical protein EBR82_57755 [Caulobacteraceae bacterium]|nr:hypothetical protein [Caulobacteraceae bacterium]